MATELAVVFATAPSTGAVDAKSDKVLIERGGVVYYTSPDIFNGHNPITDLTAASTIDLTAAEGNSAKVTGTATITDFLIDDGCEPFWITFTDDGGTISSVSTIDIPDKTGEILWKAGDRAEIIPVTGGLSQVRQYIKCDAVSGIERVKYITDATGTVTPDSDLYDILDVDVTFGGVGGTTNFVTPTGTPRDKQELILDIHHTGTLKNVTFDVGGYLELGSHKPVSLNGPLHTSGGICRVTLKYDLVNTIWHIVDVRQQGTFPWTVDISDGVQDAEDYADANFAPLTRTIVPKTADYTVLNTDTGKIFTNTGTAADVIFTLPASAGCVAGKTRFTFRNLDPTSVFNNKIEVDGTDHLVFVIAGGPIDVTGGANTKDNGTYGSHMTVEYSGGGIWSVEASSQNWS